MVAIFFILIILIAVGAVGFIFYQCNIKVTEYKRQIFALNNQLSKYKGIPFNKSESKIKKNLIINYTEPTFKYGITLSHTILYLAPSEDSYTLNKLKEKSKVKIIDEAEVNNEVWYYSLINLDSKINCNGWIKKTQFSVLMEDNSSFINKKN